MKKTFMQNLQNKNNLISLTGYRGEIQKDIESMSPVELIEWKVSTENSIKNYLFSINMPLVYKKNGKMIAEYKDGSITVIR